ncbi:MAG: hypothetical protein HOP28_18285 [Gemmatimonadales bacterium]|nr:hypothetical protein [Gemmatimonadales bacterium]
MTRKIRGVSVLVATVLAAAAPGRGPIPDDVPLVLTRLGLELQVDYGQATVGGTATLQLRNGSDRPVTQIPLLLNRLMTVSRVRAASGADLPFGQQIVVFQDDSVRQVNAVVVTSPRPIPPGDSLAIVVHYRGILVGYTETGSLYIQDHVSRDFTIIREDAYAFPMLGVPSWRVNRTIIRDPFAFAARVTVPSGLVVAMGGVPGGRVQADSLTTWSYRSTDPVPFLNITIAPYRVIESPAARIHYFPADSAGAQMVERAVSGALERYAQWFGPLGRAPQLAVMEIPEGFGSQASLTAGILQTADAFRDRAELQQLYHEISHLWNVPDLERPSPRWNEGLATFLQWRMAADLDGWAEWEPQLGRSVQSLLRRCAPPQPCSDTPFAGYGKAGLTGRSYVVGMLMFHALHQVLGADAFDRVYRDFYQRYWRTGATSADLVAAFRAANPASDRIFADWFFTARWYTRLAAGESLRQMVEAYKRP